MSKSGNWFLVDGEKKPAQEWEREGKPDWADFVTVEVSRYKALDIIRQLAYAIQHEGVDACPINISFAGKLRPVKE